MNNATLETKRRYHAKARRSNYLASMALEGISVDSRAPKANKAEVLSKYTRYKAR
ncbi:YhfG family protein [Halomonas sp. HNIBRBA4712]|uniref:YhfG family protein n=1 Tax=Halomonas sp. HNIBRBA4712 TaxID=3373087 RepID=UPI0037453653